MSTEKAEQEVLEGNLDKALADAEFKIQKAIESLSVNSQGNEKDVWAAAEACEYSSLVYSLAHNLEDQAVSPSKVESPEPLATMMEARQSLDRIRTLRKDGEKDSILEGYRTLRETADKLRISYLSLAKPKTTEQ